MALQQGTFDITGNLVDTQLVSYFLPSDPIYTSGNAAPAAVSPLSKFAAAFGLTPLEVVAFGLAAAGALFLAMGKGR